MKTPVALLSILSAVLLLVATLAAGGCQPSQGPPASQAPADSESAAVEAKADVPSGSVAEAPAGVSLEIARSDQPAEFLEPVQESQPPSLAKAEEEPVGPGEATLSGPEPPSPGKSTPAAKIDFPAEIPLSAAKEGEEEGPDAFSLKELEESRKLIEQEMAKEEIRRAEEQKRRIKQLGAPLVDNPQSLVRLHEVFPVWSDPKGKRVVMVGEVCQRKVPLEMFACTRHTKEHEAIVVVDSQAQIVHAGLLAVGAKPGSPVRFHPQYAPATGQEVEVTVTWKDAEGKLQTARAQDWIRHAQSKKPMEYPWVFAGSGFSKDEYNGKVYYQADGGDFICVSNFATAMLDLPVESSSVNQSLNYEAITERIPEEGTPITLILTPKPKAEGTAADGEKPQPPVQEVPADKPAAEKSGVAG